MARMREVTRTIESTIYTIMAVELSTNSVKTIKVTVPSAGTMTAKKREEAIRNAVPEGHAFVLVQSEETTETLYAMSEADFLKYAHVVEGGR